MNNKKWYTYNNGTATIAEGRYSTGSFVAGNKDINDVYNSVVPVSAKDNGKYYTYDSSVATIYNNLTPANVNNIWYTYIQGVRTLYNNLTPVEESGLWYTYIQGVRTLYNNLTLVEEDELWYTYIQGVRTLYNDLTPVEESGLWYTYTSGVKALAEGRYSNGAYVAGSIDINGVYNGQGYAIDLPEVEFTYLNGVANTAIYGKYFYSVSDNDWFIINNWYSDISYSIQATVLPNQNIDVIVLGSIAPFVNLDSPSWIQPKSINSGTAGITFTSQNSATVTINITGNATFEGNAIYSN